MVDYVPPSLNWDEVSHGYNAYSILKTGKDEWGVQFPTIFRAYGDYKLPIYIYLTAVSEFFFGLNTLSIRLPSILAGTFTVLFTYLLVFHLTKKKDLSLISAFLVAVEPWGLFTSRFASEANLSVFFIVAGTYFLLRGLKEKGRVLLIGALLLGLSVWTYNSVRIFVPLFVVGLIVIYKNQFLEIVKNKKLFFGLAFISLLFFVPMFIQLLEPSGSARYGWVKILDTGAIEKINYARNHSSLPGVANRLLNNKFAYFISIVWSNYFTHFNPTFLFLKGGSNYQFNLPNFGLLYLVDLPFFILGVFYLLKNFKTKLSKIILVWLILGPVAASLTRESPHTLRDIVILPAPIVIIAVGLYFFFNWLKGVKKYGNALAWAGIIVYIMALGTSIENYAKNLAFDYRNNYSWSWQYGYSEAVSYLKDNYGKYGKIIFTKKYGEPHEFLLLFWPWDPDKYRNDPNLIRFFQTNWYWVDRFDKFYFVNDWEIPHNNSVFVLESKKDRADCTTASCLLVTSPGNYPKGWKLLKTINFLDGKPAFEIYEN